MQTLLMLSLFMQVPDYAPAKLVARASLFFGAFHLPSGSSFVNTDALINANGMVAFKVGFVPGSTGNGLFFGNSAAGGLVHTSPDGSFIFVGGNNVLDQVSFAQTDSAQNGIYVYDDGLGSVQFVTNNPFGATSWGDPIINDNGVYGFRADFSGAHQWVSYDMGSVAVHAEESGSIAFLFTPDFNNARNIAGKIRYGGLGEEQPDRIVIRDQFGSETIIAEDQDANAGSIFTRFDNGVALTDTDWVAFVAYADVTDGGPVRGVFLSDGTTTLTIASESNPGIQMIEFFTPTANADGLVAFRAFTDTGLRAIFLGDGTDLTTLIKEHDTVATDLGTARIDRADSAPVFGGTPNMNADGDLVFSADLTDPDDNQIEWGKGIFTLSAMTCTATYSDYLVAWRMPATGCLVDANANGVVDVVELVLALP